MKTGQKQFISRQLLSPITRINKERGFIYFQKAAALGDEDALFFLYSAFKDGEDGLEKDPIRAACYNRMRDEKSMNKTKIFPNIDKICPLPPKPMPPS